MREIQKEWANLMDSNWIPFNYREFYDVPRTLIFEIVDQFIMFDSKFDEIIDEYDENYQIWLIKNPNEFDWSTSWGNLPRESDTLIGRIAVKDVIFDETLRKFIDIQVFHKAGLENLFNQ
jgi:hypothetical protein